jgi:hypothetical protein
MSRDAPVMIAVLAVDSASPFLSLSAADSLFRLE